MMEDFIPKKPSKDVISIRISTDLLKEIDVAAKEADMSRNELINQCIGYALSRIVASPKQD